MVPPGEKDESPCSRLNLEAELAIKLELRDAAETPADEGEKYCWGACGGGASLFVLEILDSGNVGDPHSGDPLWVVTGTLMSK